MLHKHVPQAGESTCKGSYMDEKRAFQKWKWSAVKVCIQPFTGDSKQHTVEEPHTKAGGSPANQYWGGQKCLPRGGVPINFFEEEGGKIACRNILEGGKVPGVF